jgi:mono/diheme cytochrome c family protein
MKPVLKKALMGGGAVIGILTLTAGGYGLSLTSAFDASMSQVREIPVPTVTRSSDAAVLARGKHLVESLGACATRDCHGTDLGGGRSLELGPLGTLTGPNITPAGLAVAYSDGELVRLLKYGLKRDGRSVRFMPVQDFSWLPESDLAAVASYLRTVPPVERPSGVVALKPLAKILDRRGQLVMDVARHLSEAKPETAPAPAPTAEYGRFVARLCTGCHGEHLSGGPIPGAPPSLPIPANITQHETGLKDWSYQDFEKLLSQGVRKNGQPLNPFMPYEALAKMDEIEKKALWGHLRTVAPLPHGQR